METTVYINNKPVPLKASASTLRRYRALFNRDLLQDFTEIRETFSSGNITGAAVEYAQNFIYVLAKQADKSIPDVDTWLDSFDIFPIGDLIAPAVELWAASMATTSEEKKT